MVRHVIAAALCVMVGCGAARACDAGEAPVGCGGAEEMGARYMLNRVGKALAADKPATLRQIARGENGFRTVETYVFCVGPDGIMSAHPNPVLQGQDVRDLHDETGNRFIATMLATAKPGTIDRIRYLFPRPGETVAVPKTTFYTRAGDQVCGVGLYDGDTAPAAAETREARETRLRQRLTAGMPAGLGPDWAAFLHALEEDRAARDSAVEKAQAALGALAAVMAQR